MPSTRDLTLAADDGAPLAATLFEPQAGAPHRPVTVVGSATGVPRRYYARFAQFLADTGRPTLTFDYRGIGGSLIGPVARSPARFRDWGILDIPGVLAWARSEYPERPIHWVGHSYSGFGAGLAHNNHLIDRLLGVATMTADYRLIESRWERLRVRTLLGAMAPAVARWKGYVPGRYNGNSADLPKGVALEWAQWVLNPHFLFGVDDLPERRHFSSLVAAMRFVYATDDGWVSREGVEHLAGQFPRARETSVWRIAPAEAGGNRIGHMGFFRSELASTIWPAALAWLDGAAVGTTP